MPKKNKEKKQRTVVYTHNKTNIHKTAIKIAKIITLEAPLSYKSCGTPILREDGVEIREKKSSLKKDPATRGTLKKICGALVVKKRHPKTVSIAQSINLFNDVFFSVFEFCVPRELPRHGPTFMLIAKLNREFKKRCLVFSEDQL